MDEVNKPKSEPFEVKVNELTGPPGSRYNCGNCGGEIFVTYKILERTDPNAPILIDGHTEFRELNEWKCKDCGKIDPRLRGMVPPVTIKYTFYPKKKLPPWRLKAFWSFVACMVCAIAFVITVFIQAIRGLSYAFTDHDLAFTQEWLFHSHYGLILIIPLIFLVKKANDFMRQEIDEEEKLKHDDDKSDVS